MERLDYVNDSLTLIQQTDGLTFGTDALLLAGYISGSFREGIEIGSGSGIISLLLLSRNKLLRTTALEVQEEYAHLTERNAEQNGFSERLFAICRDARDYKSPCDVDLVYTNPPYMKADSGKSCTLSKKNIARHEICGGIGDFCRAAKRSLKYGGAFYAVYRPDRLCDLIDEMRKSGIEPKRATFVHADERAEPSMVLIEGRSGGKCGLFLTAPLIIYKDREHKQYTDDMNYIMDTGAFPELFIKRNTK